MKFTIKKGKHYSCFNLDKLQPFASKRKGKVNFSLPCWYPRSSVEYTGLNKLTGLAQFLGIHENSGRLVWHPDFENPGIIEIYGYVYSDGERTEKKIDNAVCGAEYEYSVIYSNTMQSWIFEFNGQKLLMGGKRPKLPVKCFPYFGGKSVSPNTMTVKL